MTDDPATAVSERIKLVHCTWATGLGAGAGRMETYYYRFLDHCRYDITVVSTRSKDEQFEQYDDSIPVLYTGASDRFGKLFEVFRTADIVQFQGSYDSLACEAARLAQVPVVVEVLHNIEAGSLFNNIDVTVCVSDAVAKVQRPDTNAVTILNGIDLDEFPYDESSRNPQKIILLQVSNRQKTAFNIDDIAPDLLQLDPRIELWLAGPNQNLASDDRVKFLGLSKDIAALYRQADFMTLFSRLEPFGLVAIEAMACGCLPVVSGSGGFTEIVTNGIDGWLVAPISESEAIKTISQIVGKYGSPDCGTYQEMRRSARRTVEQRFDIRDCIQEYDELYQSLIRAKGRRVQVLKGRPVPSPEAEIGDAMFHSHRQSWQEFDESMRRAAFHSDNFHNLPSTELARVFARSCALRGNQDTCLALYRKIYRSGFHSPALVEQWIESLAPGFAAEEISAATLDFANFVPQLILTLAEKLITAGRVSETIALLEQALKRSGHSSDSYDRYAAWLEKVRSLEET